MGLSTFEKTHKFLTNEVYFQGCRLCTEKLAESDATIGEYKDCICTNDVRG